MKKILSYSSIPFFLGGIIYLLFKLSTLSIRLSDSNIYFVTASHLSQGALLYRDVFFTNFPLHPYFSLIYFWALGGNLYLYFFTSAIETFLVACLIFYILLREGRTYLLATLSSFVYLFSVLVLITTDHQTGVFLASLFAVLSYLFYIRKQYILVGIFCALMILVKAYFLPVLLTYAFYFLLTRQNKNLARFVVSGVITGLIILLPFLLFAREEFFNQVIGYSLSRGAGIPKFEIGKFFAFRDFIFLAILIFNLLMIKRRLFWGLFSIFSFVFFFLYRDIYYLYLNFTAPFAVLSFHYIYQSIQSKFKTQKYVLPTILGVLFVWNMYVAYSGFATLGRVVQIDEITEIVKKSGAEFVYGNNDIAPAVSHLSGVPQLNGRVDNNENMFRSGILDASEITQDILKNKTVLVLHSAYYPMMGIESDTFSEIVDGSQIEKECRLVKRFPIHAEGYTNALAVLQCF